MQTATTTGRSPLATLALRIGELVSIRTTEGFYVLALLIDVRSVYGKLQVLIGPAKGAAVPWSTRWIDADRVR